MTLSAQIKWVTNLADFKREIEEGTTGIVAHTAKVDQLTRSLGGNGLLAAVNNYVAAIDKLGGTQKLTSAEMERVNALTTKAIEKYAALGRDAPEDVLRLHAATTRLAQGVEPLPAALEKIAPAAEKVGLASKTFNDLTGQVKATALGFLSAQAIIGGVQTAVHTLTEFVGSSIQSYASAEAAAKKMTVALQSQGTATPAVIQHFNDLATQFQRTTVYSDDLINEMEALLTQVGNVAPAQMQKALRASSDLASGLGIDLQSATMLVAKAFAGGGDELGRLKAILGEAYRPGMDMAQVLDAIQSKFGGQAQAEAETYAGKVKQLANEWDNFKESVGRAIVEDPALQALLSHLKDGITGAGEAADQYAPTISDYFVRAATGIGPLAVLVGWLNSTEQAFKSLDDQVRGMKQITPKAFMPEGDPFAALMASAKKNGDELIATWKKEDDAAKQHAAAIEALFRKFSGADAAQQMKDLDTVFRRMAQSGQLTEAQIDAIVKEALKLQGEGAHLTERLWAMVLATDALSPGLNRNALDVGKLGTQVEIVIPKIDKVWELLNKPVPYGISHLKDEFAALVVESPATMLKGVTDEVEKLSNSVGGRLTAALDKIPQTLANAFTGGGGIAGAFKAIGVSLADAIIAPVMKGLGKLQLAGISAGAGLATAIGGTAGGGMGAQVAGVAAGLGGAALAASGWGVAMAHAGVAGSLALGSATLGIGAAAVAAVVLIKKFTDNSGRKVIVKWVEENFGSFAVLQQRMASLGDEADRLWTKLTQQTGKSDKAGAAAVIQEITAALERQARTVAAQNTQLGELLGRLQSLGGGLSEALEPYLQKLRDGQMLTQENIDLLATMGRDAVPTWQQMEDVAKKYNLTIDQLGPTFQQQKMHASYQELIDDLDLLVRGGADVLGMLTKVGDGGKLSLSGVGDKIQDIVLQSMRFGTEIPENMRPWVQKLIDSGLLLDDNKNKITDISTLKFGETMQTTLETLNKTLQDLVKLMASTLPDAMSKVPRTLDIDVNERHHRTYDGDPDPTGAERHHNGTARVLPFPIVAHNGLLPDEVPAILQTGEAVLNRRAAAAVGTHAIGALNRGDRPGGTTVIQKGAIVVNGAQNPDRVVEEIMRKLRREKRLNVA